MTERITFVTQKQVRKFNNHGVRENYVAWPVCAIEREDGSSVVAKPEYVPLTERPLTRFQLALGSRAAERLVEFYGNAYRDGFKDYDCFSFVVDIATGQKLQPNERIFNSYDLGADVHQNDLQQGTVYSFVDRYDNGLHAVIGGPKPMTSLSVMGTGSQLFHMSNPTIKEIYAAPFIRELTKTDGGNTLTITGEA